MESVKLVFLTEIFSLFINYSIDLSIKIFLILVSKNKKPTSLIIKPSRCKSDASFSTFGVKCQVAHVTFRHVVRKWH